MIRQFLTRCMAVACLALAAYQPVWAAVSVTIDPKAAVSLAAGGTKTFTAKVAGSTNPAVSWSLTAPSGVSPAAGVIGSLSKAVLKNGVSTVTYHAPAAPLLRLCRRHHQRRQRCAALGCGRRHDHDRFCKTCADCGNPQYPALRGF